jgi:hypothetical protein
MILKWGRSGLLPYVLCATCRYSVVGSGTMLQAGRSRGLFLWDHWIFNWPNPSSRTVALRLTQPLTEMNTRELPWGEGRPARESDSLTAIMSRLSRRMWESRRLTTLWARTTCYRDSQLYISGWNSWPRWLGRSLCLQQERTVGNANGTSPLDNMRSLEHYLNDLMRGAGDTPDHLKGEYVTFYLQYMKHILFSLPSLSLCTVRCRM